MLGEVALKVTGQAPRAGERERWGELARVLAAELEIAAARTTVSSVPSFLAEHLRRRLWKIDKKQARAEGRELAGLFGVHESTISRDLKFIESVRARYRRADGCEMRPESFRRGRRARGYELTFQVRDGVRVR